MKISVSYCDGEIFDVEIQNIQYRDFNEPRIVFIGKRKLYCEPDAWDFVSKKNIVNGCLTGLYKSMKLVKANEKERKQFYDFLTFHRIMRTKEREEINKECYPWHKNTTLISSNGRGYNRYECNVCHERFEIDSSD